MCKLGISVRGWSLFLFDHTNMGIGPTSLFPTNHLPLSSIFHIFTFRIEPQVRAMTLSNFYVTLENPILCYGENSMVILSIFP